MSPTLRIKRFIAFWVEFVLIFGVLLLVGAATFRWKNKIDRSPAEIKTLADGQLRTSDGTAYWTQGNGTNLVLIHGVLGSKFTFQRLAPRLAPRYKLWAYDVKGMGFSAATGDIGLDGQVEQLHRFLTELKLGQVILLGHSTGGGIAQAFAAKYPAAVKHLVLVDSVDIVETSLLGSWESTNLRDLVYASLHSPYLAEVMPALSGRWIMRRILSNQYASPERIDEPTVLGHAYPWAQTGYWERAAEWLTPPTQAWMKTVRGTFGTNPYAVTVIWGASDGWFPPRQGQKLCERYRSCQFLLIEDAGHLPHEEQPERFAERLTSLLL